MFYSTASTSALEFFSKLTVAKISKKVTKVTSFKQRQQECNEMMDEVKAVTTEYKYVINGPLWRRAICHIGHDLHGHFDPNHVDFELVCGLFHTEKIAFLLPILVACQALLMFLVISLLGLKFFCFHALLLVPFAVLLWFGIKRNNHKLVSICFIANFIIMLTWILTIVFLCFGVYRPEDRFYKFIIALCKTEMMGFQLSVLCLILNFALNFYVMVYLNTNILYHAVYMYHMNTNSCCHTTECPGNQDFDPQWHNIKPEP